MEIQRSNDGKSLTVIVDIGESVTIQGRDVNVSLESSDNTYHPPYDNDDLDEVTVDAQARKSADYPHS